MVLSASESGFFAEDLLPTLDEMALDVSFALDNFERQAELMRTTDAMRESEQQYRTLADSGQALIWTSGPDKLCNYFNRPWLDFTGRALEQEMGNGWAEGVHPEDHQHCLDVYVSSFDRREKFTREYRLRRHDGEYRWLLDDGNPRFNTQGEFLGYIGHCLDITERRCAEKASRENEERLRLALSAARQGLYDLNVQTGEVKVSPEYATMLDYDPAVFRETIDAWVERLHPDDQPRAAGVFRDYVAGRRPEFQAEFRQRTRAGGWKWILSLGKIVDRSPDGQPLRMLGTCTDITERKRIESDLAAQLAELRRWHEATLGRETRVLELKREVNELLAQTGQPPRYASAVSDDSREK
jgi:PAS domain S-box-containing protein